MGQCTIPEPWWQDRVPETEPPDNMPRPQSQASFSGLPRTSLAGDCRAEHGVWQRQNPYSESHCLSPKTHCRRYAKATLHFLCEQLLLNWESGWENEKGPEVRIYFPEKIEFINGLLNLQCLGCCIRFCYKILLGFLQFKEYVLRSTMLLNKGYN